MTKNLVNIETSKRIEESDGTQNQFNLNQYTGYGVAICAMSGKDSPIDLITCEWWGVELV